MANSIAYAASPAMDSPKQSAEIIPFRRAGDAREEDDVPYDGQTRAERTRKPFVMLDPALMADMAPKVGPSAFTVYAFLIQHYNRRTRECHPSQALLAELTGLTERTVREALGKLEEAGYITRTRRHSADGRRDTDGFTLPHYLPEKSSGRYSQPEALPEELPEKSSAPYKVEPDRTRNKPSHTPLPPTHQNGHAEPRADDEYIELLGDERIKKFAAALHDVDRDFSVGWLRNRLREFHAEVPGLTLDELKDGLNEGFAQFNRRCDSDRASIKSFRALGRTFLLDALKEQRA